MNTLPEWADEIIASYESKAAGCFLLHGNVNDRVLVKPKGAATTLGNLTDFIQESLLPRFDVIITYDMGFGLKVERGKKIFSKWPTYAESPTLPNKPINAARVLTHYLQYCRNLHIMGMKPPKVAIILKQAHLACPALPNLLNYELSALAALIRSWAADDRLQEFGQAAFLISENLNGVHPLVTKCPRLKHVPIPLPETEQIAETLKILTPQCPKALEGFSGKESEVAGRLTGATLSSVESLLKRREHDGQPLTDDSLSELKKQLVERDCEGLIDFVEPDRTLDDCIGLAGVKSWLKQDITLWQKNQLEALPMGYLFCGPVGTGKTYLAECLAGEAGVPVVTMRNFRDRWVGSTEANLEKIFSSPLGRLKFE